MYHSFYVFKTYSRVLNKHAGTLVKTAKKNSIAARLFRTEQKVSFKKREKKSKRKDVNNNNKKLKEWNVRNQLTAVKNMLRR